MYTIYHIEGIKIGCTDDIKRRIKQQGYPIYSILEEHDDIMTASNRELELQKEYGYKVDTTPYYQIIKMSSKGGAVNVASGHAYRMGKISGAKNAKISGHMSALAKLGGIAGGKTGGKIAGAKHIASGHMIKMQKAREISVEQRDLYGNLIAEYKSGTEAARVLQLQKSSISMVCKGNFKQTGGYIFNYKNK